MDLGLYTTFTALLWMLAFMVALIKWLAFCEVKQWKSQMGDHVASLHEWSRKHYHTFDGRGGVWNDITVISNPQVYRERCPRLCCIGFVIRSATELLVISWQIQERRGEI